MVTYPQKPMIDVQPKADGHGETVCAEEKYGSYVFHSGAVRPKFLRTL